MGIDDKDYLHFGTDLLSSQHDQVVAFRNGNFVTNDYKNEAERNEAIEKQKANIRQVSFQKW